MKRRTLHICILILYIIFISYPVCIDFISQLKRNEALFAYVNTHYEILHSDDVITTKTNLISSTTEKPTLSLNSLTYCLYDAASGRVLFEKDKDTKRAMASTTKIMTCIIALEQGKPDDIVTVSDYAATMPDVQLGIRAGEQYYLSDLLYSLMLESHNDTAVSIAEHIAGSVEGFSALMNKKARELGAVTTNFVTPNGLDAEEHYSTAEDMCIIGAYATKNKEFLNITNATSHSFTELNGKRFFTVANKNSYLKQESDAIGIKTGFTGNAGYCFVGAVKNKDIYVITSVLASGWPPNKSYKWRDTGKLIELCRQYFKIKTAAITGLPRSLPIIYGTGCYIDSILCDAPEDISLLMADWETLSCHMIMKDNLVAPIQCEDKIGELCIYINDNVYQCYDIRAGKSIEAVNFSFIIACLISIW